jgi:Flp pilus assembly protein TadG
MESEGGDRTMRAGTARRSCGRARTPFRACRFVRGRSAGGQRLRARKDDGYSVVEATITLPIVIVLTMLVVQYALLWHGRNVAEAAAQDGLRRARAYQATAAMGKQAALDYLSQVAPKLLTSKHVDAARTASTVTVRVRAHVSTILGFGSFTVDESAAGPVERFVAPGQGPG